LEKIGLLANYLRRLDQEQLPIATTYFTGRAFAQSDLRTLQVGGSIIYRAMMAASRLSDAEFRRMAHSHGDAAKPHSKRWTDTPSPNRFALRQSRDFFDALHKVRGPLAKTELLRSRLASFLRERVNTCQDSQRRLTYRFAGGPGRRSNCLRI
jgi:DNA ligase-1